MGLDIFATELKESKKGKIIQLHGDFDDTTSIQFTRFMDTFLDDQKPDVVVLDCKEIASFSSKALSAVSKLYQNLKILKKGLILARVSKSMENVIETKNFQGNIPTYNELERAVEIAYYFIQKKSTFTKRKLESIRETPIALKRDELEDRTSIFKQIGISDNNFNKSMSKTVKRPRTSQTVKKYTTEDFTAWFKPDQSRIIRNQKIDVLLIQHPDIAPAMHVSKEITNICISYRLSFNKILPLETHITWSLGLEIINNSKLIIIDFTLLPEQSEKNIQLMTLASIARMQKIENQLVLLNTTEKMPVLWRELPVIPYDVDSKSIEKLKSKLDLKLLALRKSKD